MTERASRLKDPATPPLIEVALTAQFEALEGLGSAEMGRLWGAAYRADFPKAEEHPPVDHVVELRRPALSQRPRFIVETTPMPPRMFFVNEPGNQLIQLQRDRLSYNWRKRGNAYDYPHYQSTREAFSERFSQLAQFVSEEKLGEIAIDQCELTYVNHVVYRPDEARSAHRFVGELVQPWKASYGSLAGAELEDVSFVARHVLRDADGEFAGRLIVSVEPRFRVSDKAPLYKVQLTARGKPPGTDLQAALAFLDDSHARLRSAFSELMSPELQDHWRERYDGG